MRCKGLIFLLLLFLASFAQAGEFKLGLAYDISRDGHGFDLHKVGDTYILFFYTYDEVGDPEWLLGTGTLVDGVITGDLNRYRYNSANSPAQTADSGFTGQFRLDASDTAVDAACNDGIDRGAASQLTSFYWEANETSGAWCAQFLYGGEQETTPYRGGVWYAGEQDAGYGFSMSQQGNTLAAVLYYYDAQGEPRWSLGLGPEGEPIALDHYQGFCRTCAPVSTVSQPAGALDLVWDDATPDGPVFGLAGLRQDYPVAPFGEFDRDFELYRLSDGQARADRQPEAISTQAFYDTFISSQIIQERCINCHVEGGVSGSTRLVFGRRDESGYQENNAAQLQALVDEEGADYILNKARGGNGHGGGAQLAGDSLGYADLVLFFNVMTGQNLGGGDTIELFTNVAMKPWDQTLRKAALLFAGRLPTDAEIQIARGGNEAAFREAIRGLMTGPNFRNFLIEGANDRLLTDRWLQDTFVDPVFNDLYPEYNRMAIANYLETERLNAQGDGEAANIEYERVMGNLQRASAREPLELIAHVVQGDRPYSEILTADYTMVNPMLAEAYASNTSFSDPEDPHEWRVGRNNGQISPDNSLISREGNNYYEYLSGGIPVDMPHAGVLNTPAFLARYPSTATNRNRARARWAYYFFLGVDIEAAASRPTDPEALADRNNPTLNNPACAVCHTDMDPVAGAFQNYGDVGMYRDQWDGADSLPDSYKYDDGSPYVFGDTWYRDMRTPGFNGVAAPNKEASLQWLAQEIVKDERFAPATAAFWWPAVMGRQPIKAPQESNDADYAQRLAAFEAQNGYIQSTGTRFREDNASGRGTLRLKDLLVDLVMSPWFRADGLSGPISDEQAVLLDLAEVTGERLLTPKQLERKIEAVTGFVWQEWDHWARPGEKTSALSDHHRLYYGGIDSRGITRRQTEMTSVMGTVVAAMAAQSTCQIIGRDLQRPPAQRLLFANTNPLISPSIEGATVADINSTSPEQPDTVSFSAEITSGDKHIRVAFPNDYATEDSDRNLFVNHLEVRRGNQVIQSIDVSNASEISGFENDNECNSATSDGLNFYCGGTMSFPLSLTTGGNITLEASAYATQSGDEPARLILAIESDDPNADTPNARALRDTLAHLHGSMLGEDLTRDDPEVDLVFELMMDRRTLAFEQGGNTSHYQCKWALGVDDSQEMLPAWQSALVYFLTDYRFLYE